MINSLFFLTAVLFLSFRMFPPEDKTKTRGILFLLLFIILIPTGYFDLTFVGWALTLAVIDLYLLFYARAYENFGKWCAGEAVLFLLCAGAICILPGTIKFSVFPLLFASAAYLWMLYLGRRISVPLCLSFLFFLAVFGYGSAKESPWLMTTCMYLLIYLMEYLYQGFSTAFRTSTADFQTQVMLHHYEEVKSVYLNMRGWRHDYHNHIQTLKAYLSLDQIRQASTYLNELEQDLKQVDSLVKSGNLMVDAILNSKLSLANEKEIAMNCKAIAPETLPVSDVDLCVIIGNLMDNAIEACEKIEPQKRFIRVYMDIVHSQFYLSILNSAVEELNFNQKNYISEKRGNHGNGMRRVKLTVDKYDGYLNLKNEPGVFASELMIPM